MNTRILVYLTKKKSVLNDVRIIEPVLLEQFEYIMSALVNSPVLIKNNIEFTGYEYLSKLFGAAIEDEGTCIHFSYIWYYQELIIVVRESIQCSIGLCKMNA